MFKNINFLSLILFVIISNFVHSQPIEEINKIIKQPLTVESIWKNYEFSSKGFPGFNGMNDGEHFTKINFEQGKFSITKHAFQNYSGEGEILVAEKDLLYKGVSIQVDDYSFNADETKLLITTNTESVYRRSYIADFYILDLKTKKIAPLDEERTGSTLAEFSPDGSKIAFIHSNNIFIKDLTSGKITQVTSDGEKNKIINGTTDWVYEEEFALTKGFDWSPDSKYISFLKFNESQVQEFQLAYYGKLYPEIYKYKYPKAGEDNSKVTAHVFNLTSKKTITLNLGEYEYIPRLQWSNSANQLVIQTLNRHQNHVKYQLADFTGKSLVQKVIFEEKSDTYVDIDDNLIILKDGKSLLRTSESSGFMHIYQVGFDGTNKQITQGNWDVIEFLGISDDNQTIFYTSAEKGAIYKGIYKINLNGSNKMALSEETGYNRAEFSKGMKYFVKYNSDANTPNVISLCNANGEELQVLESNQKLKDKMNKYNLSKKEFMTIDGAAGKLNAWMIKPMNFDPSKKYPVYINIYGGPGSNTVTDEFDGNDYMYHQLLAQRGYIVFSVDPRGTMFQGATFKKSTYLQLGKLELEDFIAAAKELGKMTFVDKNRIGIQGWSYGGYMTSLAMTKGADYFKMGIAVAPVTNWRFYDNIYTERFMRTPQENAAGYDDNSPINFANKVKGKYFLIHGSGDDNVHYQNSMEMITALTTANVQFDLFIYPNKDHGIYGGNTRNHLFNMLFNYTLENL
jgi:dipeptidyl-peptidase-4